MSTKIFAARGNTRGHNRRLNEPCKRHNPPSSSSVCPPPLKASTSEAPPRRTGVDLLGCSTAAAPANKLRNVRLGKTARYEVQAPMWESTSDRELRRWLIDNYRCEKFNRRSETTTMLLAMSAERALFDASETATEPSAGPDSERPSSSTFQILRRTVNEFESWVQKKILVDAVPIPSGRNPADIRWDATISRGVDGVVGVTLKWSESEEGYLVTRMTHAAVLRCTTQMRKGDVVVSLNGTLLRPNDDTAGMLNKCGKNARFVLRAPTSLAPAQPSPLPSPSRQIRKETLDIVKLSQDRDESIRVAAAEKRASQDFCQSETAPWRALGGIRISGGGASISRGIQV